VRGPEAISAQMASTSPDGPAVKSRRNSLQSEQTAQQPPDERNADSVPTNVGHDIEVDNQHEDDIDSDSALGSNASDDGTSLSSSAYAYAYENGRRYNAYRAGSYPLPNDGDEQDRLDLAHHIFRLILDGKLYQAPIVGTLQHPQPSVQRVLDVGTGTGIWAMDFADEFPEATVTGTDLSPIQPKWVPPNCQFYIEDAESEWIYGDYGATFDFIHTRGLAGSISDWVKLYKQMYKNLKPGGWVEIQEYNCNAYYNDDETAKKAIWCQTWLKTLDDASIKFGKRLDVADHQKGWLEEAGFVNVTDMVVKIPIGPWTKDKKLKHIGRFTRPMMLQTVDSYTLHLYTQVLGRSLEETHLEMAHVKRELLDPTLHMYLVYHFLVGRKPEVP